MAIHFGDQRSSTRAVCGQSLRLLLVQILSDASRTLTIPELIERCEKEGVIFEARPSKLISDTLRWETRKGRVVRVGRGQYRFGKAPRSTCWWLHQKVSVLRARLVELRRSDSAPASPSLPRRFTPGERPPWPRTATTEPDLANPI